MTVQIAEMVGYDYPIGPVGVETPEELGSMPHRRLTFPSTYARDTFLRRAMEPLVGPTEADFKARAPLAGGKYDSFFRKSGNQVLVRAWTRDPAVGHELDYFIQSKIYEVNDDK